MNSQKVQNSMQAALTYEDQQFKESNIKKRDEISEEEQ